MIKGLTVHQPWAWLIVKRFKTYETRHWPTSYRGELAIHAGKAGTVHQFETWEAIREHIIPEANLPRWDKLLRGYVLGTVTLVDCIPTRALHGLSSQERALGDFTPGRYGWKLENPVVFDEPRPWRGKQGLWDIELDDNVRLQNARDRIQQLRLFD